MNHIIVDGFNLAYRSHYAFSNLTTSSGLSSGCIYGFLIGIRTIKNKFSNCHLTVAWDNDAVRRKSIYAGYKSNRSKMIFIEQIIDLKKILYNLNVSQTEYPGEEADDVIASLVKTYKTDDNQIYIYSNDKDMLQLVKDGHVIVIKPKWGKHPEKYYDEEAVRGEFKIEPKKFACFQCFRGDKVDNIPGVPRLKSSIIADLINKYETPANVYENLDNVELTDYERESIIKSKSQVLLNMQLVKLKDDLKLDIKKGTPNLESLEEYLKKYEIKAIKPTIFVGSFRDITAVLKKAPAIESYSLFD